MAGIDEAGRGPLAGPVVAAAVVFPRACATPGVKDSKLLSNTQREILFSEIMETALAVGVGVMSHEVIDRINILQATFLAMHEAVRQLGIRPHYLLVDGNRFLGTGIPFQTIVRGDAQCTSIAAASIVAKVTRDRMMVEFDTHFPGYGFARHKGYPTREHCAAIRRLGYSPIHRRSFHLAESGKWAREVLRVVDEAKE